MPSNRLSLISLLVSALFAGTNLVAASPAAATSLAQTQPSMELGATVKPTAAEPPSELTGQILYEFLLAEVALQRGQPQIAAQAYADLARRTRDPRVARRATEIAAYANQRSLALDSARIWNEVEPESEAGRILGALLVAGDRVDEAKPHLAQSLARTQSDPARFAQALGQLSALLSGAKDKAAGLRVLRELVAPHSAVPEARLAVAQAAAAADNDTLALEEAQAASKLRPAWEQPVLFEAGVLQKKSPAAAIARLRAFIDANPKSREVRLAHARALVADKQFDAAREQFAGLRTDFPDNVDVVYALGLLSLQLEDHAQAETQFKRLLELPFRDRPLVHLYLGQIAEDKKRYPEALDWYKQVEQGDHFLTAQIRASSVLSKQGDLAGARKLLQNAEATNEQQRTQLTLAESQLLRDANQSQEAFTMLEQALDKIPNSAELLYDYAMVAEKLDKVDVMESSLRKVINLRPNYAHAYNALGYSFADRGIRLDEARMLIEKALTITPDDYYIIDSLGWVLYRQGDLPGALRELERAYKGRPDAEIAAHLGEVLWVSGRRDEAEKLLREAVKKTPENDTLKKTIARFLNSQTSKQ
jgi:tetratricopeptide (TPR) repeat protein